MTTKSQTPWLTAKEEKRLAKIKSLIKRLEKGEHIQNRQLKTWLTQEEYEGMVEAWELEKWVREEKKWEIENKPSEIREYEDLCREAYFLKNKLRGYRGTKSWIKEKWKTTYLAKCQEAIEYLEESVVGDRELEKWFDYQFKSVTTATTRTSTDFIIRNTEAIDSALGVEDLPRVVTSRKETYQGDSPSRELPWLQEHTGKPMMTIREVKIEALEGAAEQLETKPLTEKEIEKDSVRSLKEIRELLKGMNKEEII
jgi:hypothetical protein